MTPQGVLRLAHLRVAGFSPSREVLIVALLGVAAVAVVWVVSSRNQSTARAEAWTGSDQWSLGRTQPGLVVAGQVDLPLHPGAARPIDVSFTNPGTEALRVDEVAVSIASVRAPRSTDRRPCGRADFAVEQGSLGDLVVAAGSTTRLSDTPRPVSQWPRLRMLDTTTNQDGCKGATVTLAYRTVGRPI